MIVTYPTKSGRVVVMAVSHFSETDGEGAGGGGLFVAIDR